MSSPIQTAQSQKEHHVRVLNFRFVILWFAFLLIVASASGVLLCVQALRSGELSQMKSYTEMAYFFTQAVFSPIATRVGTVIALALSVFVASKARQLYLSSTLLLLAYFLAYLLPFLGRFIWG